MTKTAQKTRTLYMDLIEDDNDDQATEAIHYVKYHRPIWNRQPVKIA